MVLVFRVLLVTLMASTVSGAVEAACSSSKFNQFRSAVNSAIRSGPACDRATKRKGASISSICSACRSTIVKWDLADSLQRQNRGCFASAEGRKLSSLFSRYRRDIQFMKRGCGY